MTPSITLRLKKGFYRWILFLRNRPLRIISSVILGFVTGILLGNIAPGLELPNPFKHYPRFTEVLKTSGLDLRPTNNGFGWSDYDGDGLLDLALAKNSGEFNLYHNNGDGTFTEVSKQAGFGKENLRTTAVSFGDYDNDGCPDLYLVNRGPRDSLDSPGAKDRLYRNRCDGTFTDVSNTSGIADSYHGESASWIDYNHDGYLDLFVVNFDVVVYNPDWTVKGWKGEPDILYRNNGDGTFTNVSEKTGLGGLAKCDHPQGFPIYSRKSERFNQPANNIIDWKLHWQPLWFDYDNDGWSDLYIAHDAGISVLYKNNGDGTFTDTTEASGLCHQGSGMGLTVGDYNGDGYLDLYVSHTGRNLLWRNNGNGTFSEVSEEAGVANFGYLGWGVEFLDYDNDGDLDLHTVNGFTENPFGQQGVYRKGEQLYQNDGSGRFIEVSKKEGIVGEEAKFASAIADYNNDGFVDILVGTDPFRQEKISNKLYRNTPNGNRWLTVQLIGTKSNRDAVGARLILKSGGKTQIREVISGSSFKGQDSLWQTFGLGGVREVEEVEIRWPSGIRQVVKDIKSNQKIVITEKEF